MEPIIQTLFLLIVWLLTPCLLLWGIMARDQGQPNKGATLLSCAASLFMTFLAILIGVPTYG